MPLDCPNIRTSLDLLTLKQASFKVATEEASRTGNFEIAKQLKKEIETLTTSLHEAILPTQIEQAEALFDKEHIITPQDIEKTFNFHIETKDIPPIPFTKQELQEAKAKGQTLRLTWDILPDGTILSGEKMVEILGGKQFNRKALLSNDRWTKNEDFKNEVPRRGWALTSNDVIHTNKKNYLEQTNLLIKECPDTPVYKKAIQEYEKQKPYIQRLWQDYGKNVQEISHFLGTLEITTLIRDSFSERLQQMIIHNRKTGRNTLTDRNRYYWTSSRSSDGNLISIGEFNNSIGLSIIKRSPGDYGEFGNHLGVCFSRRR